MAAKGADTSGRSPTRCSNCGASDHDWCDKGAKFVPQRTVTKAEALRMFGNWLNDVGRKMKR